MNNEALAIIQELIIQQRETATGLTAHEEEVLKEFIESVSNKNKFTTYYNLNNISNICVNNDKIEFTSDNQKVYLSKIESAVLEKVNLTGSTEVYLKIKLLADEENTLCRIVEIS